MKKKSRILKSCVCALAGLFILAGNIAYADTQRFVVDIAYGYDGTVKEGMPIPVLVEIRNEGDAFEGTANLHVDSQIVYACDIAIGAGDTKSVSFYVSGISNHSPVRVTVDDDRGKTVYSRDDTVRATPYSSPLVGILSDDYGALSYFSGLLLTDQSTSMSYPITVNLSKSLDSSDQNSLDMFDLIVINDFDTGSLTQGQGELLKTWVERGGTLLTGTGAHYQKTISGFLSEYLSGTMGFIAPETGYLGLKDDYNINESSGLTMEVLDIRLEGGTAFDDRWYQTVQKGLGNVAVLQFDLAGKNLLDWTYRDQAVSSIINDVLRDKPGQQSFYMIDNTWVGRIISNVYINAIPNIGHYITILAVYIILLPVIYLVMKKRDKRHFIWITVPVLSVLFGITVYVTGSGSRLKNPNLNYLCLLTLSERNAQETVYIGTTSPRNREYDFSINSEYSLTALNRYDYYRDMGNVNDAPRFRIKKSPSAHNVSVRNNAAFETDYFRAEKSSDSIGDIRVRMEYLVDGCHVSVANSTGLEIENAGVVIPDYGVIKIDRLGAGETAELDESDIQFGYYNDPAYVIMPYDEQAGERYVSRRSQLSNYCSISSYRRYEPYFIGFTSGYVPDLGDNPHIDTAGDAMITKNAEITSSGNEVYIPNIMLCAVSFEGYGGDSSDYLYESNPLIVTYEFNGLTLDSLRIQDMGSTEPRAMVSFYNFETEEYDVVFRNGATLEDSLGPYLKSEHTLIARYEVDPDGGEYSARMPVITGFGAPESYE